MIPLKTPEELKRMRVACRLSAELLREVAAQVRPGATTGELDAFAAERALRYELNPNEATFGRGWYRRLLRMHRHAWAGVGR